MLEVIAAYIDEKYSKHLTTIYKTIIGGGCLIMKDVNDLKDEKPYRYIILYNEIQDNMGNEIDFFINIKDKNERNAAVDYILKKNLWDYFDKIKFDYNDEYKTIYNDYYKEIGYVVRCCSVDKIELYKDISKAKIESKKQYELLNKKFDENEAGKAIFNYKDLIKRNVDRKFTKINKNFDFTFPSYFMFVNKDFFDVLRDYDTEQKYQKSLSTIFNTIIGGDCLIMKDLHDKNDDNPFRYIILYNEIQDNTGNEIDFFIDIKDKTERNAAVDYILKHNLWDYFDKIKFDYKDEYKRIYNNNGKEIGYAVRCCSVDKIENYKELSKAKI
jgi:predicted phosphatase